MRRRHMSRKFCQTFLSAGFLAGICFSLPLAAQVPVVLPADRALAASSWKTLSDGLHDKALTRRADATVALGSIGPRPEVVRLLEAGLADPQAPVREISASTLGHMRSRASIPKLTALLQDKSADVSFTAARALWEMSDTSGREFFLAILSGDRGGGPKANLSDQMREAKATLGNPKELALIGVKQGASALLGPFALGITLGERLATDRSAPTRALCADLLARDHDPDSIAALEDALFDKNWVVRAAAAKALGVQGRLQSLPKLQPLLQDKRAAVRFLAAASIIRITRFRPPLTAPAPPKKSAAPQ